MQEKIETITINNIEYVRKDSLSESTQKVDGMKYVIVRTYSAGVFAGYGYGDGYGDGSGDGSG